LQSLRGVTLPDDEVMALLRDEFVVGWRNIHKDEFVGLSHGYKKTQTAIGTTNGAGGRNVQLVVMAHDGTVLHVLPGFWHPEDLAGELRWARTLHRLWLDAGKSRDEKVKMLELMRRRHVRGFSPDMIARSDWQGFDRWFEMERQQKEPRDTVARDADGAPVMRGVAFELKPVCVLVHDRMAARPFQQFDAFDMERFVDYGRPYYDNNEGLDKGKSFPAAVKSNERREREKAATEAAAAKAEARAKKGKSAAAR
jgi:hypothetical protein